MAQISMRKLNDNELVMPQGNEAVSVYNGKKFMGIIVYDKVAKIMTAEVSDNATESVKNQLENITKLLANKKGFTFVYADQYCQ